MSSSSVDRVCTPPLAVRDAILPIMVRSPVRMTTPTASPSKIPELEKAMFLASSGRSLAASTCDDGWQCERTQEGESRAATMKAATAQVRPDSLP